MWHKRKRIMPTARQVLEEFRGYNHNPRIRDTEFYEMENISSDG